MQHWPEVPTHLPRHGSAVAQRCGRWLFRRLGWKIQGTLPDLPKMVIAVAPHTSNWDFVIAMSASLGLGVQISFLGKHSIFVWPLRAFLLRFGGIPVRRDQPQGVVSKVAAYFHHSPQLILGLSPEGTRSKVTTWRSGFWNIAKTAQVPIQLLGLDYQSKQLVFGPLLYPSDNFVEDCATMRLFFQQMQAKKPEFA